MSPRMDALITLLMLFERAVVVVLILLIIFRVGRVISDAMNRYEWMQRVRNETRQNRYVDRRRSDHRRDGRAGGVGSVAVKFRGKL